MSSRVEFRFKPNRAGIAKISTGNQKAWEEVMRRAERIAAACNAQSSWGGYDSARVDGAKSPTANVWDYSDRGEADPDRSNRLLRNLDAARG